MKIARYKKAQRTINFYKNNFNFRDPLQVLIDATFCHQALQYQINIKDQIPKYLQSDVKLVTTQCIIVEADSLGSHLVGATQIIKQFLVHRCEHQKESISGEKCIKSMIKGNNYIVATQDRELQESLRLLAGQPLLYLHQRTPVLEQPSDISKRLVEKKCENINENDIKRLTTLKTLEGVPDNKCAEAGKKRRKIKQPNPMSCKKKKPKPSKLLNINVNNGSVTKKSRPRLKIAKHIKEHLQ